MKFTLNEKQWYVMECVSTSGERHHSPIWLSKITSRNTGEVALQIEFFHANYPTGKRDRVFDLEVLHCDRGYLLAMRVEGQERVATVILEAATIEWLERTMPDVAGTVTEETPLEQTLDLLTGRDPSEVCFPALGGRSELHCS